MKTSITETLTLLTQKFPAAFSLEFGPRKVLKRGIREDIQAALPDLDLGRLKRALVCYANHGKYLDSVINGAVRVGLDGTPAGIVNEAEAAHAISVRKEQAVRRSAKDRARIAAVAKTNAAAKAKQAKAPDLKPLKPELKRDPAPKPPAKPLQMSLASLRESAARRRAASEAPQLEVTT